MSPRSTTLGVIDEGVANGTKPLYEEADGRRWRDASYGRAYVEWRSSTYRPQQLARLRYRCAAARQGLQRVSVKTRTFTKRHNFVSYNDDDQFDWLAIVILVRQVLTHSGTAGE